MIIYCGGCGYSNQSDDAFCGSCGTSFDRSGEQVVEPEPELNPGDLVCGQCGAGNTPTRHFCRRCGTALADAPVARTGWWQRLRSRLHKPPLAGPRPRW